MNNFEHEMSRVVQAFVSEIAALARRAAVETLSAGFEHSTVTPMTGAKAPKRLGRPRGGRSQGKRTTEDLEALSLRFSSFVTKNPGLRVEQINAQLGTTTKDLALPIRKLISEGRIATKGRKRSTTYYGPKKTA